MEKYTIAVFGGIITIITSLLTVHIKNRFDMHKFQKQLDSEKQQFEKELAEKMASARSDSQNYADCLAEQIGIGFIYWGSEAGLQKEKVFIPPVGRILIGRDLKNDLVLDDMTVSRDHAAIRVTNGTPYLENLAAMNGTILNGKAIESAIPLSHLDEITIGCQKLTYHQLH